MNKIKQKLIKIKPLLIVYRRVRNLLYPAKRNPYTAIRKKLEKEDKKRALKSKELTRLHEKLEELKLAQIKEWDSFVYCAGYYYQGYKRIGINGIKPTEPRIENYEIFEYFSREKTVLDIGSNAGWMSCYISDFTKEVDAIELNPYLNKMGVITSDFLNISNVNFIAANFIEYQITKKYDLVFSLSNHYTIDGNLNIGFESYISKIFNVMNNEGILFFESHNINDDDNDLELKFEIASKYFTLVKYKMVKAFFPQDIDKLFAVFAKRDLPGSAEKLNFNLESAKHRYSY